MTKNEYGIDLVGRLDSLVDLVLNKHQADIIVPIERKGIRVLELSKYAGDLFDHQKVLYFSSLAFHAKEIKNKRIVLFDESVRTGKSLGQKFSQLELLSVKKNLNLRIKTAALLINDRVENKPDIRLDDMIFDQNLYNILSNELIFKILSTGKPLDVDHPIAKLTIKDEDIPILLNHLKTISYSKELGHSGEFSDVRLFTIDFQDEFIIPKFSQYPILFDDGPKKIRLFLKDNNLSCIPIVFPCMDISDETSLKRDSCQICKFNNDKSICKIIHLSDTLEKSKNKLRIFQSSLCYQCVTYELNCRLLGLFLHKLSNKITFEYKGLEKRNLNAIYYNEADKIREILEEKIDRYRMGNENPGFAEDAAESCELISIPPMSREYYLDNIRPEYEVSIAIAKNSIRNKPLYNHADYKSENQKIGLSYKQIFETLDGIDEHDFSEGMDIALDIGLIKPETPLKGINLTKDDKSFIGITRVYCTAGENIDKSMNFFFDLAVKEKVA